MHNKSTFNSVILPISSVTSSRRNSNNFILTQPSFFSSKISNPSSSFKFPHKFSILIAFIYNLAQWLIINLVEKYALELKPELNSLHQYLSLGFMLACFIILFYAQYRLPKISPFNGFVCFAIANFCLAVSTFSNQYSIMHRALQINSLPTYYSLLFNYLLIIPNVLIADALFSPFYLKVIPLSGNLLALVLAFLGSNISHIGFYWIHLWLCFFSIIIISAGKSLLPFSKINKTSETNQAWGPAHQQALQIVPSLVAIVNRDNKVVYGNEEFNKYIAKYPQNLLEKIVAIRSRVPEKEKQELLASGRNSVIRFDQTESHLVMSKHFEEDHFDQSIHENMRSQTLCYYSNLLEVIKILNEANNKVSFISTKVNNVFNFEGKIFNHEYGLPPTHLEIKISKIAQSKEILLIINPASSTNEFNTPRDHADEYKENLLATVSHEMRAPLNGNLTLIEAALGREDISNDLRNKYLVPAHRSGKLLLHLVNDILDTAQIKAKKLRINPTRQSLKDTVENCCQLLDIKAKMQCVKLTYEMDPQIPDLFMTDHSRLSQIILNLLSNALKFTFEGEVKVATKLVTPGLVEFNVTDSGIGMSQEDVSQLFRQFTRISYGKRKNINTTGVGLGLTIANKLVKALGPVRNRGIKVESQPDQGSTFSFIVQEGKSNADEEDELTVQDSERPFNLRENDSCKASFGLRRLNFNNDGSYSPSSAAGEDKTQFEGFEENNDANKPYESPSPKKLKKIIDKEKIREVQSNSDNIFKTLIKSSYNLMKKKSQEQQMTVLIVDDEPFNILAIETLMNKLGIKMESACNGKEAIEKVLKNSQEASSGATYKVIFMDCQMPLMNGYEATEVLVSMFKEGELKEIPIIGCSGYQDPEHIEKCKESGMNDVISKPIIKDDFEEIIRKYVNPPQFQS